MLKLRLEFDDRPDHVYQIAIDFGYPEGNREALEKQVQKIIIEPFWEAYNEGYGNAD